MNFALSASQAGLLSLRAAVVLLGSAAGDAAVGEAPIRPAAFAQCMACHTVEAGRNGFGPSLAGVAGRKAASLPYYAYSDALRKSGLTWNAATLDRWLTSPQATVPGTKMPFRGVADPAKRQEVVEYLLSLR